MSDNHKIKVLLVEDNIVNQVLVQSYLEDSDYALDIAANGKVAIEKNEQQDYKCILMDLDMPVMDGYDATQHIRQQIKYKDLPIIALTANTIKGTKEKCITIGMNDYCSKPFNRKKLIELLLKWIKNDNQNK